jgi:hypothetical protein
MRAGAKFAWAGGCQRRLGTHYAKRFSEYEPVPRGTGRAVLFADAELRNYGFIPFRVVLLQVVKQTTTSAHHHEKSAARAVVLLVRLEVVRQLANALA